MRYINPRFTDLLTYLLRNLQCCIVDHQDSDERCLRCLSRTYVRKSYWYVRTYEDAILPEV